MEPTPNANWEIIRIVVADPAAMKALVANIVGAPEATRGKTKKAKKTKRKLKDKERAKAVKKPKAAKGTGKKTAGKRKTKVK